jgi:hypothetical protein
MFGFGLVTKLIGKLISLALFIIVVGALLWVFSPAKMIRKGVTSFGPKVTQTSIELSDIGVSWLSGKGDIKGLRLGNPEGYKADSAIEVPVATVAIKPTSIFSDKLVIKSIEIEGPFITYETKMSGSNLTKIQENIDEFVAKVKKVAGSSASTGADAPSGGKKLQVDEIIIRNAKVKLALTALGGRGANITLSEIKLTGLGQGPEGITGPEVLKAVWNEVVKRTTEKVTGIAGGIGEGVLKTGESILKGVSDLFKKDKE